MALAGPCRDQLPSAGVTISAGKHPETQYRIVTFVHPALVIVDVLSLFSFSLREG